VVVDHQFAVPHAELCCGMNEPVAGVKRTNSIARPAGVKERAVVIPCVNWLWLYARSRKQKKKKKQVKRDYLREPFRVSTALPKNANHHEE
jgi:hypothetical protein